MSSTFQRQTVFVSLESCNIEATTLKGVNAWLATIALGKGKNKVIDTAAAEFVAACSKIDDGSKKSVDKIAVEWGSSSSGHFSNGLH